MLRVVLVLACSSLAFAQLDSYALRAKFGSPLQREVFHIPAGFDLTVDYAPDTRVCRLEVPALMPSSEKVQNLETMKQRMYAFLLEIVPAEIRGPELGRMTTYVGAVFISTIQYENIVLTEVGSANSPFSKDHTITATFNHEPCAN